MARIKMHPARTLVFGFLITIIVGTILLSLPQAVENNRRIPLVDALFTATSAVTTTGLVVVDTGTTFSLLGEIVILSLFQVGALGYMAFATLLALIMGKKISLRQRLILKESLYQPTLKGIVHFTKLILIITLSIEMLGAFFLFLHWRAEYPIGRAIYLGIFHSVSAFCTAGFYLFKDSFLRYQVDPSFNLTILPLMICGSLGFLVLYNLLCYRQFGHLIRHTKLVLSMALILFSLGLGVVFIANYTNPQLLPFSRGEKLLTSSFQALAASTTTGFNTLNIESLNKVSLLFMLLLMFVGGAPGSTAGGIKTTTFAIILATIWGTLRGKREINIFRRRLSYEIITKSLILVLIALLFLFLITLVMMATEREAPSKILFEVTSAMGTVGLSLGITSQLSLIGRLLIILTMFAGRIGPLVLLFALVGKEEKISYKYPEEEVIIG